MPHLRYNIVLIGMPGVGKSTVGVLLAKAASRGFIDTDLLIQNSTGRTLQEIIDADGLEAFCRIEERCVLEISARNAVIATGGSVVYSAPAMKHLKDGGAVVHLDLPLEILKRRLADISSRGVVMPRHQTLDELYARRRPLYLKYADATIDTTGMNHAQVVEAIRHCVAVK